MSRPNSVNPYTPSALAGDPQATAMMRPARSTGVSSLELCVWTIGVCILSGCLFGLLTFGFFVVAAIASGDLTAGNGELFGAMLMTLYGLILGGIVALLGSIPAVIGVLVVSIAVGQHGAGWNRTTVGRFAACSGLLAGFLPVAVMSGFAPGGAMFAIVPALFGCLASRLMIIPLTRKAGDRGKPLSNQPVGNYPED